MVILILVGILPLISACESEKVLSATDGSTITVPGDWYEVKGTDIKSMFIESDSDV